MPFFPNSALCSKNYPRNIKHMPAVIFSQALILEKIAILGQPPKVTCANECPSINGLFGV